MPQLKASSDDKYLELKKLGKLYLSLGVLGWLIFLMQKIPTPVDIPLDNIIDSAKFGLQSMIGNLIVKKICMLFLLLYTAFIAIETLVFLRLCAAWLYSKYKSNKEVH